MLEKLLQWDKDTLIYLNNLGFKEFDVFWTTVTNITTWIPLYILFFVLFFIKRPKKEALLKTVLAVLLFVFVMFLTDFTKELVARLRPSNDEDINTLIRVLKNSGGYSFFSGHASSSFSMTTLVVLFLRDKFKWVWLFYAWPLLFCVSRIYVGVHYPLDIVIGATVGVVSAFIFYGLHNKITKLYLM